MGQSGYAGLFSYLYCAQFNFCKLSTECKATRNLAVENLSGVTYVIPGALRY